MIMVRKQEGKGRGKGRITHTKKEPGKGWVGKGGGRGGSQRGILKKKRKKGVGELCERFQL